MHFGSLLIPGWLSYSALLLAVVVFISAAKFAPWQLLRQAPERLHLFFGTVLTLLLVWSLAVSVTNSFSFHLLVITSAVLLLGLDAVCTVIAPALVPIFAIRLANRMKYAGVFAFTMVAAFLGGAFSVMAAVASTLLILLLAGQGELVNATWEHIGLLPLMMFAEGFLNGTLMTSLAVFHPELVRSFSVPER